MSNNYYNNGAVHNDHHKEVNINFSGGYNQHAAQILKDILGGDAEVVNCEEADGKETAGEEASKPAEDSVSRAQVPQQAIVPNPCDEPWCDLDGFFIQRIFNTQEKREKLHRLIKSFVGHEGSKLNTREADQYVWYYVMKAICEAKIVVPDRTMLAFVEQMAHWYKELFIKTKSDGTILEEDKVVGDICQSVSRERSRWMKDAREMTLSEIYNALMEQCNSSRNRRVLSYVCEAKRLCEALIQLKNELIKENDPFARVKNTTMR